jgi:hypothetical protein
MRCSSARQALILFGAGQLAWKQPPFARDSFVLFLNCNRNSAHSHSVRSFSVFQEQSISEALSRDPFSPPPTDGMVLGHVPAEIEISADSSDRQERCTVTVLR